MEYRLDVAARTATMVRQFCHRPARFTPFVGSVQRLVNGDTFIAFGADGIATEVDPGGNVVYEGRLVVDGVTAVNTYRMLMIPSLSRYAPP